MKNLNLSAHSLDNHQVDFLPKSKMRMRQKCIVKVMSEVGH